MRNGLRTLSWGQIKELPIFRECYLCFERIKDKVMPAKMDTKQKTAFITAIIAFVAGWGLTIAGFCVPPTGEVSGSVLAVLGEAMVYAASVFGVSMYFGHEMAKFRHDTRQYIDKIEREREGQAEEPESEE